MTAQEVAKYIVSKTIEEGWPITNVELQEILHLVDRRYLNIVGRRIFWDEFEEAGFGPKIPNVYYKYAGFGAGPIDISTEKVVLEKDDQNLIDHVLEEVKGLEPWELAEKVRGWDNIYYGTTCGIPEKGEIWHHFKDVDYEIICCAEHSETREIFVVYKALKNGRTFIRPLDMFMSLVDKKKYPNATQRFRFEKVGYQV